MNSTNATRAQSSSAQSTMQQQRQQPVLEEVQQGSPRSGSGTFDTSLMMRNLPNTTAGWMGRPNATNPDAQMQAPFRPRQSQVHFDRVQNIYNTRPPQNFGPGQQFIPVYSSFYHPQQEYGQGQASSAPFQGNFYGQAYGMQPSAMYSPQGVQYAAQGDLRQGGFPPSSSSVGVQQAARGPPRKPRQSGHALWVGNLSPNTSSKWSGQTRIVDLKDHFSRDATNDIQSLKLISKTNCAFVNYRSQAATQAALHRFHDSWFQGTRLVCRLRRESNDAAGPLPMDSPVKPKVENEGSKPLSKAPLGDEAINGERPTLRKTDSPARYFVLKSLTVSDLEMSTKTGIWATQPHNEQILQEAYATAEDVYLVFSANKSGEYFGFARMESSISAKVAYEMFAAIVERQKQTLARHGMPLVTEPAPSAPTSFAPQEIPTPATIWAPRGRIIDDSARGTLFWESDLTDDDAAAPDMSPRPREGSGQSLSGTEQGFGEESDLSVQPSRNAFRIRWLSLRKVPFYKTRGLRNAFNSSRELKIARDGTEIEPLVGEQLLTLFAPATGGNQAPSASLATAAMAATAATGAVAAVATFAKREDDIVKGDVSSTDGPQQEGVFEEERPDIVCGTTAVPGAVG